MIKLGVTIFVNVIRTALMKLRYGSRYKAGLVERLAFSADVDIYGRGKVILGRNIELAKGCQLLVHGTGNLVVGDLTYMNRYCMVSCHDSVHIGARCMFGPGVKIFDNNHRFSRLHGVSSDLSTAPITIGDNCWLASDVIVLKGATIGDNCIIGAGCVVSGHIPAGSIVRRVPDQIIEPLR